MLPTALDFNLLQREALGHAIGEARRAHPELTFHHDDVDPAHPLLVQALADQVARAIPPSRSPATYRSDPRRQRPRRCGQPRATVIG